MRSQTLDLIRIVGMTTIINLEKDLDENPGTASGVVLIQPDHAQNPPFDRIWMNLMRMMENICVLVYPCEADESRICPHFSVFLPPVWQELDFSKPLKILWTLKSILFYTCALCCRYRRKYSGRARRRSSSPRWGHFYQAQCAKEPTWQNRWPMSPKNFSYVRCWAQQSIIMWQSSDSCPGLICSFKSLCTW